jgi:hypothetical protein
MRDHVSVYLGKDSKKFREYAKSKGISISRLVREALEKYLLGMKK